MSKAPGTSGNMPAEKAGCGIRPSKAAMDVGFSVDFSKAKDLLPKSQDEKTKDQENQRDSDPSAKPA